MHVVSHAFMVPGVVERQHALFHLEDESPVQARAALVKPLVQLANGKARVNVRLAEALAHPRYRFGHLALAPGLAHDFLEPLGQLNGNHLCSR